MKYFILLIIIFITSCKNNIADFDSLKIYQTSNPEDALKHDISEKNIHFLATLGFATQIPGIGLIAKESCFKNVGVVLIDKTGDAFTGGSYTKIIELKSVAKEYASRYNKLLKEYLHQNGATDCSSNENWGQAFNELDDYIKGKPIRHGSGLSMNQDLPPEFTISLLDINLAEDTTTKACEIFHNNAISKSAYFILEEHGKYKGVWKRTEIASFTCENGSRSELSYKNIQE